MAGYVISNACERYWFLSSSYMSLLFRWQWVVTPTGKVLSLSTATNKVPKENAALTPCPRKVLGVPEHFNVANGSAWLASIPDRSHFVVHGKVILSTMKCPAR